MSELDIQPVSDMEGFAAAEDLQAEVWGFDDRDVVPRRMFVVIDKIGGQTLGAFAGGRLVAFSLALPGWRGGEAYWHSHMLAVDPGFRNRGLGRALKLRQREEALARGLDCIEWTFDPLEIKNSYFNLEILGAIARQYHPNLYGAYSSALQAGLPADRLTAEWQLRSPRVLQRLDGAAAGPAAAAAEATVERIGIPAEIHAWKEARDPRAAATQAANRDAFQAAFARGLAVVGFERTPAGAGAFRLGKLEDK